MFEFPYLLLLFSAVLPAAAWAALYHLVLRRRALLR